MNGFELADAICAVDDVELEDFTRDGYKTMFVLAHTHRAKERVEELADQANYSVDVDEDLEETAACRLTLRSPEKVRMGGNRL